MTEYVVKLLDYVPRLPEMEKVIRCKDCFYWRDDDFCINPQWQANAPSNGLVEFPCTFPESFCSFAEPREEQAADGGAE